ncbi:MAG: hypothetical protein Q9217_001039 [Psora testacea]
MSEVKSRSSGPRGRGSLRGGRGGFSNRGRGGSRQANGTKADVIGSPTNFEDEGEIGELKSRYSRQLSMIKEMFPDWTDEDIVFALQETNGDLESTIERITEGSVSQWGEVKKKTKDRSHSKPKEPAAAPTDTPANSVRGGRGRGSLNTARGGRGRGSERGRGATRGGRATQSGAPASKVDGVPSSESSSWDTPSTNAVAGGWDSSVGETDSTPLESSWEHVLPESVQESVAEDPKLASKPDGTRSWASMLANPKPAPKAPRAAPSHDAPMEPPITATSKPTDTGVQGLPPPVPVNDVSEIPNTPPAADLASSEQAVNITPPKDDLTETNLEKLPDISGPAASVTAASTVASTLDQRAVSGNPLQSSGQQSSRPPLGGYATSAYKAAGMPGRTPSYQRKILEQQEAVVMPGKHAVDKAAVQFGSMGLSGTSEDVDVDSDREDAETRAQPPQHSPIAPRASLPPAPQQQGLPQVQANDAYPTPRQAPGLPPVSQPSTTQQPDQKSTIESQPSAQAGYPYNQFGDRYGQQASQQEPTAPSQKPYEPFGQQLQQSHHYDSFNNAANAGLSSEARQYLAEKYASGPNNMSSYSTSDDQRNTYQTNPYGSYGQQSQQSAPDPAVSQPRTGSALGTSAGGQPSQYTASQGRLGQAPDAPNSGHSTPYGSISNQQSSNQPQHITQQGGAPGQHGGFGYGGYPYGGYYSSYNMNQVSNHPYGRERPMFDDVRRYDDHYLTQNPQYGYGGGQGGYGGGLFGGAGGKGLYGQHHPGYGMSPQTSHNQHSASPANVGAFGQQLPGSGRDSAAAGGLGSYGGRSGSTQPSENLHGTHENSMPDVFSRSQSGYQGQNQGLSTGNDDSLRGYGESSKLPGGPSPALGQSGTRPGSAANPPGQSGLPPQDARYGQQGYGGYPSQMSHGQQSSQYGGPGAGGHQSGGQTHQSGGYGAYGAGGYGGSYYGNSNRGGWSANYGH